MILILLRLFVLLALALLLPVVLGMLFPALRRAVIDREPAREPDGEELVRDPACLTYVPRSIAIPAAVAGRPYFFCSEACAERYRRIVEG